MKMCYIFVYRLNKISIQVELWNCLSLLVSLAINDNNNNNNSDNNNNNNNK